LWELAGSIPATPKKINGGEIKMSLLNKDQQIWLIRKIGEKIAETRDSEVYRIPEIGDFVVPKKVELEKSYRLHLFQKKVGVQIYAGNRRLKKLPDNVWEILRPYGRFVKNVGVFLIPPQKQDEFKAELEKLGFKYSPEPVNLK